MPNNVREIWRLRGKTIARVYHDTDDEGERKVAYDFIVVLFTDGTQLRIEEQGHTGWMSCAVSARGAHDKPDDWQPKGSWVSKA